jgi:hypothetical protein
VVARNPSIPTLRNLGLDLSNFLPTVWELVPYSFVADYFSNIGDVVSGWSQGGRNVRWCMRTVRLDSEMRYTYQGVKPPNNASWTYSLLQFKGSNLVKGQTLVFRDTYGGNFVPGLTWEIPGMSMKWANLAALVSLKSADRFL